MLEELSIGVGLYVYPSPCSNKGPCEWGNKPCRDHQSFMTKLVNKYKK